MKNTLITIMCLLLSALSVVGVRADEDRALANGEIEVKNVPPFLSEYCDKNDPKALTTFYINTNDPADAKFIFIVDSERNPNWPETYYRFFCRKNPYIKPPSDEIVEKHMKDRITEYPLVGSESLKRDFVLEIYQLPKPDKDGPEADKKDLPEIYRRKDDWYLLVLRYKGSIIWYKEILARGNKKFSERKKYEVDRPDVMTLPDGRFLIVDSESARYSQLTDGRVIQKSAGARRLNWIKETENSRWSASPPVTAGYPTVTILTDNIVRHAYPDGCIEHWMLRPSKLDVTRNKNRIQQPPDYQDFILNEIWRGEGSLLWWNGKYSQKTAFCARDMSKRHRMWCFSQGPIEPKYDKDYELKPAKTADIVPEKYMNMANDVPTTAYAPVFCPGYAAPEAKAKPEVKPEAKPGLFAVVMASIKAFFARLVS